MRSCIVLILGAAGGLGGLIADLLYAEQFDIIGVDLVPFPERTQGRLKRYITGDGAYPNDHVLAAVSVADWVISCMPQQATLDAFKSLSPCMKAGALFLDVLSVKRPVCSLMRAGRLDIECLSIHPMFAPSLGFRGQNTVLIRVREGEHSSAVESLLTRWGSSLCVMTEEEHDRSVLAIQVATHASILAFGMTLASLEYDCSKTLPIATPPHRTLLALLARIVEGRPEVYRQIQLENPEAAEVRLKMKESVEELGDLVERGSPEQFSMVLDRLRQVLGAGTDGLTKLAAQVLSIPFYNEALSSSKEQDV